MTLFLPSGAPAVALTVILAAFASHPAVASDVLGKHVVQKGETLYCIGRAYGISPDVIANANRVESYHPIYPGQILTFPKVWWERVPPGPVCRRQSLVNAPHERFDVEERRRYSDDERYSPPRSPSFHGR